VAYPFIYIERRRIAEELREAAQHEMKEQQRQNQARPFFQPSRQSQRQRQQRVQVSQPQTPKTSQKPVTSSEKTQYPSERKLGGITEKGLIHFRSTLFLEKAPEKIPGTFIVKGWVRIINPNPEPKTVELWPQIDYTVPVGMYTVTWKSLRSGKVCVCGECGDKVEVTVPANGEKKCDVEMEVEVPDLGKVSDVELDLKARYTLMRKIPGIGWVKGYQYWTVAAVLVTDEYKKLVSKTSTPSTRTGQEATSQRGQAGQETSVELKLREKEKKFWARTVLPT